LKHVRTNAGAFQQMPSRAETKMTPLVYSIPEVCKNANSGRTTVYKAINEGHLVAHKRGSRTIIFSEDLERWLKSLPEIEAKHSKRAEVLARNSSHEPNVPHEDGIDRQARERRSVI
jgi:excisionase family DNA binding protein